MHVVYSFPHVIGRPGIATTARHQVEGLARKGIAVTLFCAGVEGTLDPRIRVIRTLSSGPVRIPHRAVGVQRAYRWHDRVVAARLPHLAAVDLVHVWPAGCVQTLRAAIALGVPTAREVPNTHTGYAFDAVAREYATLGMRPLAGHSHTASHDALEREELEYQLATVLLVPSDFSRQTFVDRGFGEERLVLHQYGFDPVAFPSPTESSGPGARPESAGLQALFVGRGEPRKGLHYALRAWVDSGAARHGRFVICGSFVEGYAEVLAPWLAHPSVEVRGFVSDPAEVMRAHDILVLPSVEEGSALVTYEAQASGCVPVVSDAVGARCTHDVDGLVHPARDLATLTQQFTRLSASPDVVARLRGAALEHRPMLTWDAAADALAAAYERAVSAGTGAHLA